MTKYLGVCPGYVSSKYIEVEAETVKEARSLIWLKLYGSDYVSRILEWNPDTGKYGKEVWTESKGEIK